MQNYLHQALGVTETIRIDNSNYNSGTASGFTEGMKQVKDGFIWLLDEDNIPEPDALKKLKEFWKGGDKKNSCLASYRKGYDKLIDLDSVIGSDNACLGLNLFFYKETRKNLKYTVDDFYLPSQTRQIPCSMYGGMFFHSDLLKTIGYPNEKLFMYCDDYDWSYRITKAGGKIILVKDSIINEPESKGNLYYNTRNHLIFQKQFVTNRIKFTCNYYAYCLYLFYKRNFKKLKALKDGWNF